MCSARGQPDASALPTARHAGFNFDFPAPTGRMLVMGGEHMAEERIFNDLWSVDLNGAREWAYEAGACNVPNVSHDSLGPAGTPGKAVQPAASFSGNGWSDEASRTSWLFGGGPYAGYVASLWRVQW